MNNRHNAFMLSALAQAELFEGRCAPNPAVGAVVVKDNHVISVGAHMGPGQAHAEVLALSCLSTTEGCCLYVTLEPCCHFGRTPPCTQKIIDMGIKKVYFAYYDPNPVVAGKGQQILIDAGIECHHFPVEAITDFYRPYQKWWNEKFPYMTIKLAITNQHEFAVNTLTGTKCQTKTQEERLRHDAILTSVETILSDNPQMNTRLIEPNIKKKLFVIDRQLRCPESALVFKTCHPIILFYDENVSDIKCDRLIAAGAQLVPVATKNGGLDLQACLNYIAKEGVHALWVESGWQLASAIWSQFKVDRFIFYVAQSVADLHVKPFKFKAEVGLKREVTFDLLDDDLCITII